MFSKRTFCMVLVATVLMTFTAALLAEPPTRRELSRGVSVGASNQTQPELRASVAPDARPETAARGRSAIVGSWTGVAGDGSRLITTFHSDGTFTSSAQTEVSTNPELGVLTPTHGVWRHLGGRRFGFVLMGHIYDINSGAYMAYVKVRGVLELDETGNGMTGTDKPEIFLPDGTLLFAVPPGPVQFNRIEFEPFE